MLEKKLVTIILPTIGRPEYIVKALDSILSQDYNNLEILISDNLPEVPSRTILNHISDNRIKIVERKKRHDFSEHMNLCIKDAKGYYIMIISDDDLITSTYISNMVQAFESNDKVNVGIGFQKTLDENDFNLEQSCNVNNHNVYNGLDYILNDFHGIRNFPLYTYFSLFSKKEYILSSGGFKNYPDGSNADNYLFYSLASKGDVAVISDLMGYRVYKKSSGLSTPFEKLYNATNEYDKDMSKLIWNFKNVSLYKKIRLRFFVKLSSSRMLLGRIDNIYKSLHTKQIINRYRFRILTVFLMRNLMLKNKN